MIAIAGALLALWGGVHVDWMWVEKLPRAAYWVVFGATLPLGLLWLAAAYRGWPRHKLHASLAASVVYVLWWQLAVFTSDALGWGAARAGVANWGLGGLFLIGLVWVVWSVERASHYYQLRRRDHATADGHRKIWNPLDAEAWYYGRESRKLNQSVGALLSYSAAFMLLCLLASQIGGCQKIYELPAGGGEQQMIAQTIRIQKIIRKKFVVNPFSAILFETPPIDEVRLQLDELTAHAYTIGQGAGAGAGFGAGKPRGKVRFIRLEYSSGDWDQDFGVGADLNMLIEYGIRTQHKVADRTESLRIADLDLFPRFKAPPLVYMTGQESISLSSSEVKTMRSYLLDHHGMLFGDNGGSRHFHNQFLRMMNQVLPDVRPVPIPLDDAIHRIPFRIPFRPAARLLASRSAASLIQHQTFFRPLARSAAARTCATNN